MKLIYLLFLLESLCTIDVKAQSNEFNVYLANGDSIYYCEGSSFSIENLHRSKREDTSFLKNIISIAKEKNYTVFFKPMTSFSTGAVAEDIQNVCIFFRKNNVPYKMQETGSEENKYFDGISIIEYIKNSRLEKKVESDPSLPPPPPPPPPLSYLIGNNQKALTILIGSEDRFYYYNGSNCSKLFLGDLNSLRQIIKTRIKTTKKSELIIVIKATKKATFKNTIDILDEIVKNKAPKYSYAEEDITQTELNCIKNFKKKK